MRASNIHHACLAACIAVGVAAVGAGAEHAGAAAAAEPMTLARARERALAANPALAASRARLRAAQAGVDVVRALPNPEASYELEDFGASAAADVERQTTVTLTQSLELFGKRGARVAGARRESDVAAYDLEADRRDLLAQVDRRFAALLGAQLRLEIAGENRATADEVAAAVRALVDAGEASPIEAARAESEQALAGIDGRAAERNAAAAARALAELWGETAPAFGKAEGTLAERVPLPDPAAVLPRLVELPDLGRWTAEVGRLESRLAFARRQAVPDVAVSAGKRWYGDGGGHGYVAAVTMALPVLSQFGGARATASAELDQATQARRAAEVRVRAAFLLAHETLARSIEEAHTVREEVLPRARQVYEALNEGYRRGKFRLLDLSKHAGGSRRRGCGTSTRSCGSTRQGGRPEAVAGHELRTEKRDDALDRIRLVTFLGGGLAVVVLAPACRQERSGCPARRPARGRASRPRQRRKPRTSTGRLRRCSRPCASTDCPVHLRRVPLSDGRGQGRRGALRSRPGRRSQTMTVGHGPSPAVSCSPARSVSTGSGRSPRLAPPVSCDASRGRRRNGRRRPGARRGREHDFLQARPTSSKRPRRTRSPRPRRIASGSSTASGSPAEGPARGRGRAEAGAAERRASRARLVGLGASSRPGRAAGRGAGLPAPPSSLPVRAPFAGTVLERSLSLGALVQPGDRLILLADTSRCG